MPEREYTYNVYLPLEGASPEKLADGTGWYLVAPCESAEKAAEVVRVLCLNPNVHCPPIKVETRVKL